MNALMQKFWNAFQVGHAGRRQAFGDWYNSDSNGEASCFFHGVYRGLSLRGDYEKSLRETFPFLSTYMTMTQVHRLAELTLPAERRDHFVEQYTGSDYDESADESNPNGYASERTLGMFIALNDLYEVDREILLTAMVELFGGDTMVDPFNALDAAFALQSMAEAAKTETASQEIVTLDAGGNAVSS